nr:PREDICTED: uncharacterized protein LOC105677515 [Linepithema humile]
MNIVAQDYLLQEPRLLKTTAESLSAFSDTFNEDLDLMQFNEMNKTLAKLEIALKHYDIENIATPVIERPSCDPSLARGWMSNGFWNVSCIEYVKNFSKVYNIKYSSKKQLLSLYEAMQRLQRTEYRNTLIGIILRDVIPAVKSNIDPTSAEYARAYKTIFVLCQDLNPEVPVLVRTDS